MFDTWEELLTFEHEASAETLAELLRREGVPAIVEVQSPVPGLVESVRLVVPGNLAHRARWLLNSPKLSDRELAYMATGKLPPEDEAGA